MFDTLSGELDRFAGNGNEGAQGSAVLSRDDSLGEKIRKIGRTFKPETDMQTLTSTQDPAAIIGSIGYGSGGDKLGKVNNEIASYLMLAKGVTESGGETERKNVDPKDLEQIRDMHEAFIEGGMHTVTPETKAQLLANWMNLSLATWPAETKASETRAAKLEDFARKMPYREDKAKAVIDAFDDAGFEKLPANAKQKVMSSLFDGLDIESKLNVVVKLLAKQQRQKASACLDDLERMLAAMKDGSFRGLAPDQLTSATGASAATTISPRDVAAFEARIEECRESFLAGMPDEALSATAKAAGEMDAAQEFIGPNETPRPAIAGERKALRSRVEDAIVRAEHVLGELIRSASTVTLARDRREVARCLSGVQTTIKELRTVAARYAG